MSIISALFLLLILAFGDDGGGMFLIAFLEYLLVTTPRGFMGIMVMKRGYPQKLCKFY
jgi:hypothetical protein